MISINKLKKWIETYKFGKYISREELISHLEGVAKKSLEDKLILEKRAELNEKQKERLHEELKNV